jgi:uncharacterized protein YkwD
LTPAAAAAACPNATTPAAELGMPALESSVTCLVNERRAQRGAAPVRNHRKLRSAARRQSKAMVSQGFFDHTWPNGLTFEQRIRASGFTRGARQWMAGENLAWGTGTLSSPESLVTAWMNSPDHRANLLRAQFRQIGVAAVRGTPFDSGDGAGVTITTEYGFRRR